MKDNKLIDNEEDIEQKFGCTYETKIIQYNSNFRLMTISFKTTIYFIVVLYRT